MEKYGKLVDFVHLLIRQSYEGKENLEFIDATCGNGFDTLFLCKVAGKTGHVTSFDIQESAIERTKILLSSNLNFSNYNIINDSHEFINKYIDKNIDKNIDAAIFNLGYLPFSDKKITTTSETTLNAIKNLLPIINKDGRIYITTYISHDTGKEIKEIWSYLTNLSKIEYNVINVRIINKENSPPELFIIEKNL